MISGRSKKHSRAGSLGAAPNPAQKCRKLTAGGWNERMISYRSAWHGARIVGWRDCG